MSDKLYSLDQAHGFFAVDLNQRIWKLLEKTDRTAAEDQEMLNCAYGSLYHWQQYSKGGKINVQRGLYMIAKAYLWQGKIDLGLEYAQRTHRHTQEDSEGHTDFDFFYAEEILARAYSLAGFKQKAEEHKAKAQELLHTVLDPEDLKICKSDFESGPWK